MLNDYGTIGNSILIKVISQEEVSKSGLVLKRTFGDGTPYIKGIVIKTGPGKVTQSGSRVPMVVAPGYEVALFGNDAMTIIIENEPYVITSEDMIIFYKPGSIHDYLAKEEFKKAEEKKTSKEVAPLMTPRGPDSFEAGG